MRYLLLIPLLFSAPQEDPASMCGSEIEWKKTAAEATAAARESNRLILWYVHTVNKGAMERQDVIDNYMKMGPWMMRDVVALVNRRFVALRMPGTKSELAKKCGIETLAFIEPGLVFLTPDLRMVHKVDRLSTFQEEWFVDLLRGVLAANKDFYKPVPKPTALELMADGNHDEALKVADDPLVKGKILRRMRRAAEAAEEFAKVKSDEATCEEGILLLRQARVKEALEKFSAVKSAEAAYYQGAALFMLNRNDEGEAAWKTAAGDAKSPWAWKAAAELSHKGPFFRCFEVLQWGPAPASPALPTSSISPRKEADLPTLTKQSVALLLRTQRRNGSWDDSNYVFGGEDSVPNVIMAGTALATSALLAWKEIDAAGVTAAVERAWPFLTDEKNMALDDKDEVIWGYAYRIPAFLAIAAADPAKKKECLAKTADIVSKIAKLQKKDGIWRHEYEAPFTTATVLHCLWEAKQAGVEVADAMIQRGTDALSDCRNAKGVYSYMYPAEGFKKEGAAGRMAFCELALLLWGKSNPANLRAAVDAGFEFHALLEKVRKYDNHADQFHNGGFFFWYDMVGRAEAIKRLPDKAAYAAKQRELVLSIAEIDGAFVDSHELGKTYGTAMGLLTLKLCSK